MKSLPTSLLATAMLIGGSVLQVEAAPSLETCLTRPTQVCIGILTDEFLARSAVIKDAARQGDMRYGIAVQLIQAKQFEPAEQIARSVKAKKMREPIFGTLASEYAAAGDAQNARRLLKDITDPVITTIVLTAVAQVKGTSEDLDESLQKAKTLQDEGLRFAAFDAIAKKLIAAGRLKDAEDAVELITYAPSRNFLFERIAQKLIERDQFDDALAIVGKMEAVSGRIISLTELATLFRSNGRLELGGRLLDEAHSRLSQLQPDDEKQLRARVMLAENLAVSEQIGRALAIADSLENSRDKASVWLRVVYKMRENNDVAGARKLYVKMKQAATSAKTPTERSQIVALLISHLSRVGDVDDALALIAQIKEPGRRARELQEIGTSRLKDGEVDQAETIFRSIGLPDVRARTLLTVAREMLKSNRQSDANILAEEAAKTAASLSDQAARDDLNSLVAEFHMATGSSAKARSVLTAIDNDYVRHTTLDSLAKMAKTDQHKNSLREALVLELKRTDKAGDGAKVEGFLRLINLPSPIASNNDISKLAASIDDETARGQFVTSAAYLLMEAGDYKQARRLVRDFADEETRLEFSVAELSWLLRKATDTPKQEN